MQSVKIERTNGNVVKTLPGQDHISGLLAYLSSHPANPAWGEGYSINPCSSIEQAEALGIVTTDPTKWEICMLHYHLSEVYRINPGITLYLGIYIAPAGGTYTFSEVKAMQNYADGSMRQLGVWNGSKALTATDITALQGMADALTAADRPLSIIYAPKVVRVADLPVSYAGENKCNVSILIGQDGAGIAAELRKKYAAISGTSISAIGAVLGIVSKARVHQSIASVNDFPAGVELPAFGDGTELRMLDRAIVEKLDEGRYLFFVNYDGLAGSYLNDSHTMDVATSDYAMIENVRTMDKAVRGIRRALLPKLGGSLYVTPETGQLAPYEVEYLQTIANKPLEDMRKAGELSGVSVTIDPDQNVLQTSEVVIVIKQVGVGVLRRIKCKIGFATSL